MTWWTPDPDVSACVPALQKGGKASEEVKIVGTMEENKSRVQYYTGW